MIVSHTELALIRFFSVSVDRIAHPHSVFGRHVHHHHQLVGISLFLKGGPSRIAPVCASLKHFMSAYISATGATPNTATTLRVFQITCTKRFHRRRYIAGIERVCFEHRFQTSTDHVAHNSSRTVVVVCTIDCSSSTQGSEKVRNRSGTCCEQVPNRFRTCYLSRRFGTRFERSQTGSVHMSNRSGDHSEQQLPNRGPKQGPNRFRYYYRIRTTGAEAEQSFLLTSNRTGFICSSSSISTYRSRAGSNQVRKRSQTDPEQVPNVCFFFFFFFSHTYIPFPASGQAMVTGDVVPFPPRFLPSIFIAHRFQQPHCSSVLCMPNRSGSYSEHATNMALLLRY